GAWVEARERRAWGSRRIDADGVLGEVPANRGDETVGARILAQTVDERRDRVPRVVVSRPAGESQAAGHGQRPSRIVGREPELARSDLDSRREAGVEVDVCDLVDRETRMVQGGAPNGVDRVR